MTIKAIETVYNGYRFRSRLEARWAVFFDTLGIKYEYEPEGYVLPSGARYLPDFKLILPSEEIVFAEVKGSDIDEHEGPHVEHCRELATETGKNMLLLIGPPAYRMYNMVGPGYAADAFSAAMFQDYHPYVRVADNYWFSLAVMDHDTGALLFPFDDRRAAKAFGKRYVDAVTAARQARFEHGETPKAPAQRISREEVPDAIRNARKILERYRAYLANHDAEYAKLYPAGLHPKFDDPAHKAADRREVEWIVQKYESVLARFDRGDTSMLTKQSPL